MAAVILGGLVTSTVMSLIVLPALVLAYRWPLTERKGEAPDAPAADRG